MKESDFVRFFNAADKESQKAYGIHTGVSEFECPLCHKNAVVRGRYGTGVAYCQSCGVVVARGKEKIRVPDPVQRLVDCTTVKEQEQAIDQMPIEECRAALKYWAELFMR